MVNYWTFSESLTLRVEQMYVFSPAAMFFVGKLNNIFA